MFDFEKVHRSHKLAFLDGLLCGALFAIGLNKLRTDTKELLKARRSETNAEPNN